MHKFTKFLLMLLFVLLIIYFIINGFANSIEHEDMASKIGTRGINGGGSLTMNEYYTLAQCFETYSDFISQKDYKKAYSMLGTNYRYYVTYEEYEEKMKDKSADEMIIHDINIITQTTFDLVVGGAQSGDNEEHYSLIINNDNNTFALYPESFLDYNNKEINTSKSRVKYILKDYLVNINECILNFEITNNNNKPLTITKALLTTTSENEIDNTDIIEIPPKETKNITIKFNTEYEFPQKVSLENNFKNIEISLY